MREKIRLSPETEEIRLSPETIEQCFVVIKRENNIPCDKKCSQETLASLFYKNGGFDRSENRAFSKSTVIKILKGQFVDELSVREFLFFLKLIPQTDPEGGIDEFLHKPLSKTPSTVSPYPLLKEQLNFEDIRYLFQEKLLKKFKNVLRN